MEVSNQGGSIYHRFYSSYSRRLDGTLIYAAGPHGHLVKDSWTSIQSQLLEAGSHPPSHVHNGTAASYHTVRLAQSSVQAPEHGHGQSLLAREIQQPGQYHVVGIIVQADENQKSDSAEFENFFCGLLLQQLQLPPDTSPISHGGEAGGITDAIVDLFDSRLRYTSSDDQWHITGREYFWQRVHQFTSRTARIHLCLPAFPCKSSNPDKVSGTMPDRGEELALTTLHRFVQAIGKIYRPGAKLWIISDGHVFSDCIGVDDAEVDAYGESLSVMNDAVAQKLGSHDAVGFKSLVDLFGLADNASGDPRRARGLPIPAIDHHIATAFTEEAETSRKILMHGCQPNREAVRAKIEVQDASILALYRGFSRFMLEDLEFNKYTRSLSRSQQKKLSAKVSFEMIMRNQAYSNLVELVFPTYVRLSIHAHRNSGPKFGIQLFGHGTVKATEQLSPDGLTMSSRDLLHIPTPWHNCVVEIRGHSTLYVTKSKVVHKALADTAFTGGLVVGDGISQGSYYQLDAELSTPVQPTSSTAHVTVESKYESEKSTYQPELLRLQEAMPLMQTERLYGPLTAVVTLTGMLLKLLVLPAWGTLRRLSHDMAPRWTSDSVRGSV